MHRVVGRRSGRRAGGPSLPARLGALLAVVAVALLAAPFASGALEPIERPHLVAASSSAPALTARADERASGSTPLRSGWALSRITAHPGIQTSGGISARRDAAELGANGPLLRWVLGHGTTTSLP